MPLRHSVGLTPAHATVSLAHVDLMCLCRVRRQGYSPRGAEFMLLKPEIVTGGAPHKFLLSLASSRGSCHVVLLRCLILDLRVRPGSYGYCGAGHDDPIISAGRVV